jgi:DNA-binding NarL/FixJ family response regulator
MKDNYTKPNDAVQPTSRQRRIIQLLARGKVNKEIAAALKISVKTVEAHRATIMLKFHFHSLADLVLYAIREGVASAQVVSPKARAAKTGQR